MRVLQRQMGSHITIEDVQWCLTVPAIWDNRSILEEEMKICASMAGMTKGSWCPSNSIDSASPYPLIFVPEPDAVALYCERKFHLPLRNFLVVDDRGTVNLVSHEKIGVRSGLKVERCPYVREVSPTSDSGLCGGCVDKAFFDFCCRKISCFRVFSRTHTDSALKLFGWWDIIKFEFDGSLQFSYELELPARLSRAWEVYETSNNRFPTVSGSGYDTIELSLDDMRRLFDAAVDGILRLIELNMTEGLNGMAIVGSFSSSPYLVKRIKETFSARVCAIIVPSDPEALRSCGAVLNGIWR